MCAVRGRALCPPHCVRAPHWPKEVEGSGRSALLHRVRAPLLPAFAETERNRVSDGVGALCPPALCAGAVVSKSESFASHFWVRLWVVFVGVLRPFGRAYFSALENP